MPKRTKNIGDRIKEVSWAMTGKANEMIKDGWRIWGIGQWSESYSDMVFTLVKLEPIEDDDEED